MPVYSLVPYCYFIGKFIECRRVKGYFKVLVIFRNICIIPYVFFKNNCPYVGALYDQFSICDIESGDVLFCCQHLEKGSHGCDKAHWEIYGRENDFKNTLIEGTWNECKKWFNA